MNVWENSNSPNPRAFISKCNSTKTGTSVTSEPASLYYLVLNEGCVIFALAKLRACIVFDSAPYSLSAYLIYDVGFLFLAFGFALPEEKYF